MIRLSFNSGRSRRYNDDNDRRRRLIARLLATLTIASGVYYIVWAFHAVNPAHPVMGAIFLTAEMCCLGLFIVAATGVWRLRFKPEDGVAPDRPYRVDVLIPVCGEPIGVIRRTLQAACAIHWGGEKHVLVLDDGDSDEVKAVCESLRLEYWSRLDEGQERRNAKAGNLNFGLSKSSAEFVLVLDADQVPVPHILQALAGYMRFPKVAFVQSKQTFHVPDDDPFSSKDRVFYEALQLGLDAGDSVISCGSGVLYRRAALDEIGGFATWNLVEDLTTSYELHCHGWKSFYYPHALSIGLAPQAVHEVYQQRGQWAFDTMRLFFWDNPLFKRGLAPFQRASYLIIGLSYLSSAFVFPFFFIIPIWSYLTGGNVLYKHELEFAAIRGVYFVCMATAMQFLFRHVQPGKQFQMLTGLFPVYARGVLRALAYPRGRKPAYRPNNRTSERAAPPRALTTLPQLLIVVANAVLPFYAVVKATVPARLIAANIAISALAIWSLLPIILAAFHAPAVDVDAARESYDLAR